MAFTFESIATNTLNVATTNVNFNSIPQTYTDLRLVYQIVCAAGSPYAYARINNDSSASYSFQGMYANSTTNSSWRSISRQQIDINYNYSLDPSSYTTGWLDFMSYRQGSIVRSVLGQSFRYNAAQEANVYTWHNTTEITSINLVQSAGQFGAGSTFTLYGILRA